MRTLAVRAAIYTPVHPLWQAKFLVFFQKLRQHAKKIPPRTARCAHVQIDTFFEFYPLTSPGKYVY